MNTLHRYLPVIIWCGIIFLFSSWETPPSPQDTLLNFIIKKTAHIIEYAILYYLSYRTFSEEPSARSLTTRKRNPQKQVSVLQSYLNPFLFTILYAISDEVHQSFVTGRHGKWYDVLIDTAGAVIAIIYLDQKGKDNKSRKTRQI